MRYFILFIILVSLLCTRPERDNPFDHQSSTYGPPTVIAQKDTTVDINDSIKISAEAKDNRGIDKLIWYGAVADTSDTSFIIISFADTGKDTVFVVAIDIDGVESNEDTVIITVTKGLPIIEPKNDTIVSESIDFIITAKAYDSNKSGTIISYLWDIGGDGWDDTTSDSLYSVNSTIGDTNLIIYAAIDDDNIMATDTFNLIFNHIPSNAILNTDSLWEEFDIFTKVGRLYCEVNAFDPDGLLDTLTYTVMISEDSLDWSVVYAGDSSEFILKNLKSQKTYFYKIKVCDLLGDSLVVNGLFTSPTGPAIPDGMVFVPLEDSSFIMGSENGSSNEEPVHVVNFTHNLWIDTTEVTQYMYSTVLSDPDHGYENYSSPNWNQDDGIGDSIPAYFVNWYDAALYCNSLSKIRKQDTVYTYDSIIGIPGNYCELTNIEIDYSKTGYRLPTEAEWEYACGVGDTTMYYWGSNGSLADDYAWHGSNSSYIVQGVAQKLPNSLNLYDISGNLWEWCNDNYGSYTADTLTDPTGLVSGNYKVKRGGAWNLNSYYLRTTVRNSSTPYSADIYIGFRTVLPD